MRIIVDIDCPVHGQHADELVDNETWDAGTRTYACPLGDEPHRCTRDDILYAGPSGIIHANAEHSKQLGVTFESNAQKRAYMREHPNLVEMGKGDANDRAMGDRIRARADMAAERMGYQDEQHRKQHVKYAMDRGYDPAAQKRR